ncbi:MAG: hypothetical protein ACP5NX_03095 [Candidatus Bilamarchaeaceae archaeon]
MRTMLCLFVTLVAMAGVVSAGTLQTANTACGIARGFVFVILIAGLLLAGAVYWSAKRLQGEAKGRRTLWAEGILMVTLVLSVVLYVGVAVFNLSYPYKEICEPKPIEVGVGIISAKVNIAVDKMMPPQQTQKASPDGGAAAAEEEIIIIVQKTDMKTAGTACSANSECASGTCARRFIYDDLGGYTRTDSICMECAKDSQCGDGEYCSTTDDPCGPANDCMTCVRKQGLPHGETGSLCTRDAQCGAVQANGTTYQLKCIGGTCLLKEGDPCGQSAYCGSGCCLKGVCTQFSKCGTKQLFQDCTGQGECAGKMMCTYFVCSDVYKQMCADMKSRGVWYQPRGCYVQKCRDDSGCIDGQFCCQPGDACAWNSAFDPRYFCIAKGETGKLACKSGRECLSGICRQDGMCG